MERLFQNVIWPAAAGNVAWAFFTVITKPEWSEGDFWARLLVLLFVAVYLGADWKNTDSMSVKQQLRPLYWIADAFLAVATVVFAIAIESRLPWANWALVALFIVAIGGHATGLWAPKTGTYKRCTLIGINASGLVIVFVGLFLPAFSICAPPVAVTLVVLLYLGFLRRHGIV
jgi:hypothetical protein